MQANNEIGGLNRYVSTDALLLIGRILFSLIFIWSGFGKIVNFEGMSGYIGSLGLPVPELFNVIEIIIELGGGLALFFGVLFRLATLAIIVHTIIASLLVHHFWSVGCGSGAQPDHPLHEERHHRRRPAVPECAGTGRDQPRQDVWRQIEPYRIHLMRSGGVRKGAAVFISKWPPHLNQR